MKTFKEFMNEESGCGAPTNATGTAVSGTGDDSSTVPIKPKKKKKPTPIGRYRTRVAWKESFTIDKDAHKKAQKKSKLRNLAKGNTNPNEKAAAEKKAGGPKLSFEEFLGKTSY